MVAAGRLKTPHASPDSQQLAGQPVAPGLPTSRAEQEKLFQEFLEWSRKPMAGDNRSAV